MDYQSAWEELKDWLVEGVDYMKENMEKNRFTDLELVYSAQGKGYKITLGKMEELENKQKKLRNESTEETRAIWRAVDNAAAKAPEWAKRKVEKILFVNKKCKVLIDDGNFEEGKVVGYNSIENIVEVKLTKSGENIITTREFVIQEN